MSVLPVSEFQASDGAGNTHGAPAYHTFFRQLPTGIEIHIVTCLRRCLLPEVDKCGSPICEVDQHESATPDVTRERMRYCKHEAHRHSGIDRIAAGSQYINPDINRMFLDGDKHCPASVNGLPTLRFGSDKNDYQ